MKRCHHCGEAKLHVEFYRNRARRDGLSTYCKVCEKKISGPAGKTDSGRAKRREYARRRRVRLIEMFGGACACCGETQYEFLQFDHINGDGADHRRELGRSNLAVSDILKRMSEFQLLCANCNFAKGMHGKCPHTSNAELEHALQLALEADPDPKTWAALAK